MVPCFHLGIRTSRSAIEDRVTSMFNLRCLIPLQDTDHQENYSEWFAENAEINQRLNYQQEIKSYRDQNLQTQSHNCWNWRESFGGLREDPSTVTLWYSRKWGINDGSTPAVHRSKSWMIFLSVRNKLGLKNYLSGLTSLTLWPREFENNFGNLPAILSLWEASVST